MSSNSSLTAKVSFIDVFMLIPIVIKTLKDGSAPQRASLLLFQVNLIKCATIGKMSFMCILPATKSLINFEQFDFWKLAGIFFSNYRSRGYQIAANFSGDRSDWMVELGSLYPNIVRIEAGDLIRHEAATALLHTIHSFGASLLVRDIETTAQLKAAIRAGADYLQGNLLGEPMRTVGMSELSQDAEK